MEKSTDKPISAADFDNLLKQSIKLKSIRNHLSTPQQQQSILEIETDKEQIFFSADKHSLVQILKDLLYALDESLEHEVVHQLLIMNQSLEKICRVADSFYSGKFGVNSLINK